MPAKKANQEPEATIPKTAAEDVAFQPDDLSFPEAPSMPSAAAGVGQIGQEPDNSHPAAKQAIILGVAGILLILGGFLLAIKAIEGTEPLTEQAATLTVVDSQITAIDGSVEISKDNGLTWTQAATGEPVKSGDLLMTGFDGRAEVSSTTGIYLRIDSSSQVQVLSLNSQQMSVELYGGTVFARNSQADDTNDVIKVTAGNITYSARSAGFTTDVIGEGHATRVYAGSATTIGTENLIINQGMESGNGTPVIDFTDFATPTNEDFLSWNAERDRDLELINNELGLLESY